MGKHRASKLWAELDALVVIGPGMAIVELSLTEICHDPTAISKDRSTYVAGLIFPLSMTREDQSQVNQAFETLLPTCPCMFFWQNRFDFSVKLLLTTAFSSHF